MTVPAFPYFQKVATLCWMLVMGGFGTSLFSADRGFTDRALYYLDEAGRAHLDANRLEEADKIFSEMVERSKEWDMPDWASRSLWLRAWVHQRKTDSLDHVALLEEAFEYRREAEKRGLDLDPQAGWMLLDNLLRGYRGQRLFTRAYRKHLEMVDQAREATGWDGEFEASAFPGPDTELALFGNLARNEATFLLKQGRAETSLRLLIDVASRLEKADWPDPALAVVLARNYSDQITLMKFMGKRDEIFLVVEKLKHLPEVPSIGFYLNAEKVRVGYIRVLDDPAFFETAWRDAQIGIRYFEQSNYEEMALHCRRFLPLMLSAVGRHEEARAKMDAILADAEALLPSVPSQLSGASVTLFFEYGTPTSDVFSEALRSYQRTGMINSVPLTYKAYSRFLYRTSTPTDARHYARLGLFLAELLEGSRTRSILADLVETWSEESDQDAIDGVSQHPIVVFDQDERVGELDNAMRANANAFDFVAVRYRVPLRFNEAPINFRARASQPMRIEFRCSASGALIAVDVDGDGDFEGAGDLAFRDSRRDGFPEFAPVEAGGASTVTAIYFPFAVEPVHVSSDRSVSITLEIQRDGSWETWAKTQFALP